MEKWKIPDDLVPDSKAKVCNGPLCGGILKHSSLFFTRKNGMPRPPCKNANHTTVE